MTEMSPTVTGLRHCSWRDLRLERTLAEVEVPEND